MSLSKKKSRSLWLALFLYCLLIARVTLWPIGSRPGGINFIPLQEFLPELRCVADAACNWRLWALIGILIDTLGNAALFFPLGFLLQRLGFRKVILLGFVFSVCIEVLQLFISGRVFDVTDLICNACGAGAGAWVARRVDGFRSMRS